MRAMIVVMALAIAVPAQAGDRAWVLSEKGLGPIHVGMTPDQVAKIVGQPPEFEGDGELPPCADAVFPGLDGVSAIFLDGKIDSVWVHGNAPYATARGIRPGATEAEVRAAYPRAEVLAADYDNPPAANILYWIRKDKSGIEFRTDETRKVVSVAAGGESIQYMEGCL